MKKYLPFSLLFLLLTLTAYAQERNTQLTIQVTSVEGDNLKGQSLKITQTDYELGYGSLSLDANGKCTLMVYAGNHHVSLNRGGFIPVEQDFVVAEGETTKQINIQLTEKTRQPFALKAETVHDIFTGKNTINLSWNTEEPAFFDDFESYEPFAINFGGWTGIDVDMEAAAPLVGTYPNRGVLQYAQVINPLAVDPVWWYDYPILRPYDGKQYIGFTRTNSGNANDDWLISPVVTVGTENVLSFYAKAADRYPERFMVYVTTKTDNPAQSDFVRLDQDNYEKADYTGWKEYTYDLKAYEGKQVKFAIRYISHYNSYGSFMLMVDNVFVGMNAKASAIPNEQFQIYLDGELVTTTTDCSYVLEGIANGNHTIGIKATYLKAQSETTTIEANIPSDAYSHVILNVTANSKLTANGQHLTLTNTATMESYDLTVTDGKVELASLPNGQYAISTEEGAFQALQKAVTINADATIDITLNDYLLKPYNITAKLNDDATYTLRWNQELIFSDSFEDYDDFATGTFGGWKSIDRDGYPVYPIALGSQTNIVSFPGSGSATKPSAIAPMVFNPWKTTPAMMPTDPAIAAPTGEKCITFFSPQQAKADDWLISPVIDIHENYSLTLKAKSYSSMYPETLEFYVSDGSDNPDDFMKISIAENIPAERWTIYQVDLSQFNGMAIRIGIHYVSYDAFLCQIDDFTVGPENGEGEVVDYGNVVRYDILVDGEKIGESQTASYIIPVLSAGTHTVGIKAIYQSGESEIATYTIEGTAGIAQTAINAAMPTAVYSLSGVYMGNKLEAVPAGIYLVKHNGKTIKIRK